MIDAVARRSQLSIANYPPSMSKGNAHEMKLKRAVSIILVVGVVLTLFSVSQAVVDLRRIEEVMKKNVLTPTDLRDIDAFMKDAVTDLVRTEDFTGVSKVRSIILNHQADQAQPSARAQYALQFSESACSRKMRYSVARSLLVSTSQMPSSFPTKRRPW